MLLMSSIRTERKRRRLWAEAMSGNHQNNNVSLIKSFIFHYFLYFPLLVLIFKIVLLKWRSSFLWRSNQTTKLSSCICPGNCTLRKLWSWNIKLFLEMKVTAGLHPSNSEVQVDEQRIWLSLVFRSCDGQMKGGGGGLGKQRGFCCD